jgi:hypothetical protein
MNLTRRRFLQAGAAAALASGARIPRAMAAAPDRKFLFFFASGGWDTTTVLDPHFDSDGVDMDQDTHLAELGNLRWTAGDDRPGVSRFFRRWGARACIVNGMNVHSVGHDSAAQFVMTGTSASSFSDWPTILAANARGEVPLPHLVFGGPSFPGTRGATVVRAGGGTLLDLIDGSIVGETDEPTSVLSSPANGMIDAFVHDRVAAFAAGRTGNGGERAQGMLSNLDRSMDLEGRLFEAGLDRIGSSPLEQAIAAAELMRLGLSRCAMIQVDGGFDTHSNIMQQATNQEAFYVALDALMDHLAATPGNAASFLIDEITIVALSEFGRTPLLNGGGGKDHWPYGSALLVGSGVKGNQVVGATDDELIALPIDLSTGHESASGDLLGCENLGAAILELGGLDPDQFLPGVPSLRAVLR